MRARRRSSATATPSSRYCSTLAHSCERHQPRRVAAGRGGRGVAVGSCGAAGDVPPRCRLDGVRHQCWTYEAGERGAASRIDMRRARRRVRAMPMRRTIRGAATRARWWRSTPGEHPACRPTGRGVGRWPWDSPEPVHILTAWNPGDERPGAVGQPGAPGRLEADLDPARARGGRPRDHSGHGRARRGSGGAGSRGGAGAGLGRATARTPSSSGRRHEWAIVGCRVSRRVAFGWSAATALGVRRSMS